MNHNSIKNSFTFLISSIRQLKKGQKNHEEDVTPTRLDVKL